MFFVEENWDPVAAAIFGFGVERLVDVADEVKKELECLVVVVLVQIRVENAGCLI